MFGQKRSPGMNKGRYFYFPHFLYLMRLKISLVPNGACFMLKFFSALVLLLQSGVAYALLPVTVSLPVTINFEKFSSEINVDERNKVNFALNEILKDDWCPYVQGIVNGRASADEGTDEERKTLASLRAEHVKQILDDAGFPKERVYMLVERSLFTLESAPGRLVELRFDGFPGHPNCQIPKNSKGFRTAE
jgi:hypothetical protein